MSIVIFFFFNDTATTEIYTLSLHDALPIWQRGPHHAPGRTTLQRQALQVEHHHRTRRVRGLRPPSPGTEGLGGDRRDRKSTRLNSSHANISYAVFCLKKKKQIPNTLRHSAL